MVYITHLSSKVDVPRSHPIKGGAPITTRLSYALPLYLRAHRSNGSVQKLHARRQHCRDTEPAVQRRVHSQGAAHEQLALLTEAHLPARGNCCKNSLH
jgi:hypothetical protein